MILISFILASQVSAATFFDVGLLVHKRKVNQVTDIHSFIKLSEYGTINEYELATMVKKLSNRLTEQEPLWVQWHPVFNYLMVDTRPEPIVEEDGINIYTIRPDMEVNRLSQKSIFKITHLMEKLKNKSIVKIIRAFDSVSMP
jgi:hypothetical protein